MGAIAVGLEEYALVGDEFLMRTGDGLGFHYRKGQGVTVEIAVQADPADEGLYLNGSVYAAAASINGFYPHHASAAAFAFIGPSGAGKSTLIAELGRRRYAGQRRRAVAVGEALGAAYEHLVALVGENLGALRLIKSLHGEARVEGELKCTIQAQRSAKTSFAHSTQVSQA